MSKISVKTERKRKKFIAAAQKEFFLKGFDRTTVEDITGRLNLSKGNFYYYFNSKEDILIAVCEHLIQNEVEKLKDIFDEEGKSPAARMVDILNVMLDTFYENESVWRHVHMDRVLHSQVFATVQANLMGFISAILKEGKEQGAFEVACPEEMGGIILAIADWSAGQYCTISDEAKRVRIIAAMEYALDAILGESCMPIFTRAELRRPREP